MLINGYIPGAAGASPRAVPLFWWEGWSTRWYVMSVFDLKGFSCPERGAFVVVRREADGRRVPLVVGAAENVSDELFVRYGDALLCAIRDGATEVHVHLAVDEEEDCRAAMQDIAAAWALPTSRLFADA